MNAFIIIETDKDDTATIFDFHQTRDEARERLAKAFKTWSEQCQNATTIMHTQDRVTMGTRTFTITEFGEVQTSPFNPVKTWHRDVK